MVPPRIALAEFRNCCSTVLCNGGYPAPSFSWSLNYCRWETRLHRGSRPRLGQQHSFLYLRRYQNLWKYTFEGTAKGKASPIFTEPVEEEFSALQWWLAGHWSGALYCTTLAFLSFRQAHSTLYVCDLAKGTYGEVPTPYAQIKYLHRDGRSKAAMLGQPAYSDRVITELVLGESDRPHLRPIAGPGAKQPPGLLPRPLIVLPQCYAL
ncbi:hypothetical protein BDN71DRAFT_1005992 [Pleurotus eryngii]|uniref:Uncharacterized protein n=1 Tax=Pleurotus eryngii TaxID=5323 RepID=A0A9P5ZUY6_PLEER|nr:hypothetical protein BDN71DRAFT_1005992 [Pleurotus eryngii]